VGLDLRGPSMAVVSIYLAAQALKPHVATILIGVSIHQALADQIPSPHNKAMKDVGLKAI
jgi:hypothetical protein